MKERIFETIVGFAVLVCTAIFFLYAYNKSSWKDVNGYIVVAKFENADGISNGSLVKISGIKVGLVTDISVDLSTYLASIKMTIDKNIKLPRDTEAVISSEGLLGGKYIALSPGCETENLQENDEIEKTRGAQNLESLIGKFLMAPKDSKNPEN